MANYTCIEIPEPDFDLSFDEEIALAFVDDENMVANLSEKAIKGDPFTYEDFTPEQLESLKGPQGDPQTRDGLDLGVDDPPEFANVQITDLDSTHAPTGVIPALTWTWLDALPKSVLSVLVSLISNLHYHLITYTHAPSNAEQNINADWNAIEGDAQILNKPDIPEAATRDSLGLDTDDSPLFADIQSNALNTTAQTGGEISPTLWAWIVSVYAGIVAKSVKSHIIGIWSVVETLWKERSEIYSTVLANAVASVLINVDSQGNAFSLKECEVLILTPSMANSGVTMLIRTGNHNYTSGGNYNITGFVMAFGGYGSITLTKLVYDSNFKTVFQNTQQQMLTGTATSASGIYNGFIKNQEKLTPITEISVVSLGMNIPIGTKIIVRNAKRSIN